MVVEPPAAAPDDAPDEDEPPELPPQAATSRASALAASATAERLAIEPVCCRGAIDAPFRDLRGVRSSQPTTHHANVGRGARSADAARRRPARSWTADGKGAFRRPSRHRPRGRCRTVGVKDTCHPDDDKLALQPWRTSY